MKKKGIPPIPNDTASAGKALFKKATFYRRVGDQLGELCRDCEPEPGHNGHESHATIPLLFLVTVFQYLESLSNSQATSAVLNRVDWKYALHLPLVSLGFAESDLNKYHVKLLEDPAILECLNGLLERIRDLYESQSSDKKKVDTTSMLETVSALNRYSAVVRAMHLALDELAIYHPAWLKETVLPHWLVRYGRSGTGGKAPEQREERDALALAVGEDGFFLLDALEKDDAPPHASHLPEVDYLREVWNKEFDRSAGQVNWRRPVDAASGPKSDTEGA